MIIKILPSVKKKYQLYKVFYMKDFVELSFEDREKKIQNFFGIDKQVFKTILIDSIKSYKQEI